MNTIADMFHRLKGRAFILTQLVALLALPDIHAENSRYLKQDPVTLSGSSFALENTDERPTFILLIRAEEDIPKCFHIATALEDQRQFASYLMVVDFSEKTYFQKRALKRAANRFFKSEISRQHIAFEETDTLIEALSDQQFVRTALVSSERKILWESPEYFKDINKLFEAANLR